jgi:hypothetical protein
VATLLGVRRWQGDDGGGCAVEVIEGETGSGESHKPGGQLADGTLEMQMQVGDRGSDRQGWRQENGLAVEADSRRSQ